MYGYLRETRRHVRFLSYTVSVCGGGGRGGARGCYFARRVSCAGFALARGEDVSRKDIFLFDASSSPMVFANRFIAIRVPLTKSPTSEYANIRVIYTLICMGFFFTMFV